MRPTLVALDLDGTLLDDESRLPPEHARAARELIALGAQVAIVTGRPLLTTRWAWNALGLSTPAVCFNGSWIGIPGAAPFATAVLSQDEARTAIAALRDLGGALCAYPDADTWLMDREIRHTRRWREFYGVRIDVVPERFAEWTGTSCKLMVVAEPEAMRELAPRLEQRLAGRFYFVLSQPDRIEILPRGITKAWGLERLAQHLGVARERVWAVGDADNDREMIAWAGHGCAMGHAPGAVRALARHVLPSIDERGLMALPALVAREGA